MGNNIDFTLDDLREALKEFGSFIDVTEDDLMKIYDLAIIHAKQRVAGAVPVGSIMTREIVRVKKDDDIVHAIKLLSENNISGLPVIDDEGCVIGVVSEADILYTVGIDRESTLKDIVGRMLGEPRHHHKKGDKVADIMSSPAITISKDAGVRDAARIMTDRGIKRLPVVDDANRLIGIIARADIVNHAQRH